EKRGQPFICRERIKKREEIRKKREERKSCSFRFCSRAVCSSERSGRLHRWIVLKFGQ
ncbi:unnamed protein product, partial [Linum tenue]